MISLQSHNQVLYHLTQFTSVITPRSTPFAVQVKKQNNSRNKIPENILCKRSFIEAVKNYKELAIDKLNIQNFVTPLKVSKIDMWKILEELSKKENSDIVTRNNKWKVSYVSGISFNQNKRGFPYSQLSNTIKLPTIHLYNKPQCRFIHKFYYSTIYPSNLQVKYFKTYHSIKEEIVRNPPLTARFRKWMESDGLINEGSKKNDLNNIFSKEKVEIDKLRKSQNDKYIKVDELQRIKAAFAEGYLAGHDQKHNGRTFKALKFTQQVFVILLLVVLVVVLMAMTGGGVFKIQMGNKVEVDPEDIQVTFNDVKGVEEAKSELMNIVEFLRNPNKFSALGGKLPKGVLLVGPPGTGKTLLARAVAGEAGVPFFHAAGPEFDEILVGQGARRVRELFKSAKERAPCVIFIDEIDSVGGQRTHSAIHPYANQTINQLLSEMDGFHRNEGVIVLGATNRRQDLDKALLRPGRFDSEIVVHAPDFIGRMEILELYLTRILARDINTEVLAKRTIGFTGADIENMINQAALKAAIEGAEYVTMDHIEQARDKVIMGPAGRKRAINDEENILTAYHEGGHALVSYYTKDAPPLHKVTIIPRAHSMGHTAFFPHKDMNYYTKAQMLAQMDTCMGGRAAEELTFGIDKVTSGASNDFDSATNIAEAMVKKFGMSEKVGFRVHKNNQENNNYSSTTNELIDDEIKRLLQESYDRAKAILKNHSKEHKLLAEALIKYETLDAEDVKTLLTGNKLRYETKNDVNRTIVDVPNNVI